MSATATRGGRGRVNAAVKFVLRSVADEILIVLTQSHLVLLAAVRVVRIRRRAVASPHPPHRNTLPVVGGRKLRLGRLYRVQRGRKLIGPELLAVSHLAVSLRLFCGRSTRRPQALRQQFDQIRRMRLVPQYQHARGHQGVRQQGTCRY